MSELLILHVTTLTGQLILAALTAAVVFLFSRSFRRDPLHHWAASWTALAIYYASLFAQLVPVPVEARLPISVVGSVAAFWGALWLVRGTVAFVRPEALPAVRPELLVLGLLGAASAAAPSILGGFGIQATAAWVARCVVVGSAFIASGWVLARSGRRGSVGRAVLVSSFGIYGLKLFHYLTLVGEPLPGESSFQVRLVALNLLDLLLVAAMGLGTAVWLLEREHEHAAEIRDRLRRLTFFDALTELPGRALLEENLPAVLRQAEGTAQPVTLLIADFDRFNEVNKRLGHSAGDDALRRLAQRVQAQLAAADDLYRLEGDRLAILLPGSDRLAAQETGERILAAIREPLCFGRADIFVTASLGGASVPRDARDNEELQRAADLALGEARAAGRDRLCFFEPHLSSAAQARMSREAEIRRAVANQELTLVYQPIWDLERGRIEAVEALLRWHHRERGLLSPVDFLDEAKAAGLSAQIVPWVLERAFSQVRVWSDLDPDLRLAVNLDADTFLRSDLIEQVGGFLAAAGLRPEQLELELTESVAMREPKIIVATLTRLRRRRISIALDDFGTGFSSLSLLRDLPIDTLKIDCSFVAQVDASQGARAIVSAMVALGRSLGLRVVAEGVETPSQRRVLRELGVSSAQGFLLAPPMPPEQIEGLLRGAVSRATG